MPEAKREDRKTVSLTRGAWNTLRRLQLVFDTETYSEAILCAMEYIEDERRRLKEDLREVKK